jgi:regulator of replication initiation timing
MDDAEPRPSRERKAPERIEVDDLRSRATGKRWSAHSCCPSHMDAEPSTSEPAPKPKFTGPMDKYLSDKRVEAAVNRAVKSITDNPADLERELRDFAQAGEDWRQKSMTLEQENEAIRKKLDKVTKELEKVKKEAAREIGNFNDAEDHKAILKAIVGNGYAHDESGRRLLRMHAAAIVEKIQDSTFGPKNRGDVVKNFVQYAPIKSGSAYYKKPTSEQAFPVYVENIIVRDIQLVALPKQPDILQLRAEDSKKIVLVLPREGWFFHHRPSLPWDASAVTATGQVTNSHKERLAADENYLAASLKVPPPKKKTLRSEGASQRKIVQRQEAGMTLRLRPRPARQ